MAMAPYGPLAMCSAGPCWPHLIAKVPPQLLRDQAAAHSGHTVVEPLGGAGASPPALSNFRSRCNKWLCGAMALHMAAAP